MTLRRVSDELKVVWLLLLLSLTRFTFLFQTRCCTCNDRRLRAQRESIKTSSFPPPKRWAASFVAETSRPGPVTAETNPVPQESQLNVVLYGEAHPQGAPWGQHTRTKQDPVQLGLKFSKHSGSPTHLCWFCSAGFLTCFLTNPSELKGSGPTDRIRVLVSQIRSRTAVGGSGSAHSNG